MTESQTLAYRVLPGTYAISRLPLPATGLPVPSGAFWTCVLRGNELTVYSLQADAPAGADVDSDWCVLELDGSFDFSVVGVLAQWCTPLAQAGIPIMALASHATDYLLIKQAVLAKAEHALSTAGIARLP